MPARAVARPAHRLAPAPRSLPRLERAKAQADRRLPAPARAAPTPRTQLAGTLFPGLSATDNDLWAAFSPSDSTGAKGPSDYVELVNSRMRIIPTSGGGSPSDEDLQSFFIADNLALQAHGSDPLLHPGDSIFDVQVQWDQASQRWLIASDDVEESGMTHLIFGWSKSSDPAGGWCVYRTPAAQAFEDFPKLGHDDTHLLIGTNEFDSFAAGAFLGAQLWTVATPGTTAITTCPSGASAPTLDGPHLLSSAFSPVPANIADSSAAGYVVAAPNPDLPQDHLLLYRVSGGTLDAGSTSIPVAAWRVPPGVQQPGTSSLIDSQDGRLTQAVAANGAIWTQHTVSSSDGLRAEVRWYELDAAGGTKLQEGTIADPSNSVFNAAISPSTDGSIAAITYNVGGRFHVVEARAQTRDASTGPDTLADEHTLGVSQDIDVDFTCSTNPACRWGDYAGASPDPADPSLVWGTNQLNGPVQPSQDPSWTTLNFALQFGGADPPPDTTADGFPFTSSTPTPLFNFASSETGSTFVCSIDGSPFAPCAPGATFGRPLANGIHTFYVAAIDPSGQRDPTPAQAGFTISAPAPDTAIDSGPPSSSRSTRVTFTFHSSKAGSTFQCSLDGKPWLGCASPFSTPTLALGSHTFSVRAIDSLGNVDPTPATTGFTILAQPRAGVSARRQRASRRWTVALRVSCPAARTVVCAGNVTLQLPLARPARTLTLGSARFRVNPGHAVTIRVRLNRRARSLLRRRHHFSARALFRVRSPSQRVTKPFTLLAPRRR